MKVFGNLNLIRAVYPVMVNKGAGVIVNVTGDACNNPVIDYIAGSAGNAALIAANQALGLASFKRGVRVVAVNPAATETDRIVGIWKSRAEREFGDADRWRDYYNEHPLGLPGAAPRGCRNRCLYGVREGQLYFRHRHHHGRHDRLPGYGVRLKRGSSLMRSATLAK